VRELRDENEKNALAMRRGNILEEVQNIGFFFIKNAMLSVN